MHATSRTNLSIHLLSDFSLVSFCPSSLRKGLCRLLSPRHVCFLIPTSMRLSYPQAMVSARLPAQTVPTTFFSFIFLTFSDHTHIHTCIILGGYLLDLSTKCSQSAEPG
ncbi:hypothetical protein FRB91_010764 [Serendipita sp. 411]|nr:hypothetical protein FRB91_010764 [Serendipita sp. 411]